MRKNIRLRDMGAEAALIAREEKAERDAARDRRIAAQLDGCGRRIPGVYFIETIGAPFVKIGYVHHFGTADLRMAEIQIGCPYPVRLAFVIPHGARAVEFSLHERFADLHQSGEWFRREGSLAAFLDQAAKDPDAVAKAVLQQVALRD